MSRRLVSPIRAACAVALLAAAAGPPSIAQDYVVAPTGDDAREGTLEHPWRTIQHAAAVAVAGDAVRIRAGTYRETVIPAHSGAPDAPIVFAPYQDERVVISGADAITGWKAGADGVYQAPMPGDFFVSSFHQSDQVFVDGVMVHLARWPEPGPDLSRPVKATLTAFISKQRAGTTTTVVFEDEHLPGAPDGAYVGAEIYVQPNNAGWGWTLCGRVTAYAGKRLTVQTHNDCGQDGKSEVWSVGARYYLFDQRQLLDHDGEWFHDQAAGTLSLRTPDGSDPAKHVVEAKRRDYAFDLSERSWITIQNLHFMACSLTTDRTAGGDGVPYNPDGSPRYPWRAQAWVAPSSHIVVDGVCARYLNHFTDVSGHFFMQWTQNTGLVLAGQDHVIRNCRIRYGAGNGISLQGLRHRCLGNVVWDTDYMSVDCAGISCGTATRSEDFEIADNSIDRTARCGITIRALQNSDKTRLVTRVHHNDIANFMLQDWDGGAFYTFGQDGRFTRIDHNWFHCDQAAGMVFGAYWDFSKNYVLDHNLIWGVPVPIQVTQDFDHDHAPVNNLLIYHNTAITNDAQWGRPFAANLDHGSVITDNLFKVCVFKSPTGGVVNHWPAYGSGRVTVARNVIYGNDPKGYDGNPAKVHADDLHASGPQLRDAAKGDLQLATDSRAVNAGKPFQTVERDGITVPPWNDDAVGEPDVGALEHGATPWKAGAAPALIEAQARDLPR
jgi:hypothetical protein